jgi:hypothetical protein
MIDYKIDKLLRLRMQIDGKSFNEALDDTLLRGFKQYHFFFHQFLTNDDYTDISFDAEKRTISLIDNEENTKKCSEDEMIKWKRPVHYRSSD